MHRIVRLKRPAGDPRPRPEASPMKRRTMQNVCDVLTPFSGNLPLTPSVHIDDPVSKAIEIMVKHNLSIIAVLRDTRPIGQVRLQDAFAFVGIRIP